MFNRISNVSFKGVSACVPSHVEYTRDYSRISEDERHMFVRSTGVEERRVANAQTTTVDLCEKAAVRLLKDLKWEPQSVDVIILVSQSPDYILPASAAILQHKLGLRKDVIAFDIGLGCSGYIYGLYVMANLLSSGACKRGLLLAGDKSTLSTSFNDKSTYPLFGDAGSATAMEYEEGASPLFFNLFTDGGGYQAIMIKDGGARNHVSPSTFVEEKIDEGIERAPKHLILDGIEVFNFALREAAPSIQSILQQSGIGANDIDYFVLHQANKLINESVRKKCKIDASKVPYSIQRFGNTSSASIPVTICHALQTEVKNKSLHLLLSGFGVGFSWGNAIITTNHITCPGILEYE